MRIEVKSPHLQMDQALKEYVAMRLGKVAKFVRSLEKEEELICFVELARTTHRHKHGESLFYAEAMLQLPGVKLRCEETAPDIRKAIDELQETLEREVKKYKGKKVVQR
ncbi:MAG: ribosome-associated translation inhibitor RaiA [bacterium]|nr:ribosome-associated translation inhibitor RaiA [bacterium]MDZ4232113.1 ribosome-associated translation inhibitor RaiA [Candidatus Pacearchaeota archaeon]